MESTGCPDAVPTEDAEDQARWQREEALRIRAEREGHWLAAWKCGVSPFFARKKPARDDFEGNPAHLDSIRHVCDGGGLFLFGGVGLGKTHLASTIVCELLRGHVEARPGYAPTATGFSNFLTHPDDPSQGFYMCPQRDIAFWSIPDLYGRIRSSFGREEGPGMEEIIGACVRCYLLVLDDVGAHKPTEWSEETLFRIVDGRYGEAKSTVYTSNFSLEDLIPRVGERVVDRIAEVSRVVRMSGKSRRRRS